MLVRTPLAMVLLLVAAGTEARSRSDCATLQLQIQSLEKLDAAHPLLERSRRDWNLGCRGYGLRLAMTAPALRQPAATAEPRLSPAHGAGSTAGSLNLAPRLTADSVIEARQSSRFKVTVLDPQEEAERMAPPRTRPAGSQPVQQEKPKPLF